MTRPESATSAHNLRELTALLAQVELGEEIPAELYLAVAQVIAFAYQISGKTLPTASDED